LPEEDPRQAQHDQRAEHEPSSGEMTMNDAVFKIPARATALKPAFATADPIMPPISACDELDGMP
jgi:hypothetical protein